MLIIKLFADGPSLLDYNNDTMICDLMWFDSPFGYLYDTITCKKIVVNCSKINCKFSGSVVGIDLQLNNYWSNC